MDNLFKALPRDLQWEILADFVGTHVVRNNKLMRFLTDDPMIQILRHTYGLNPSRPPNGYLKNFVIHHRRITFPHNYEMDNTRAESKLEFSHKEKFVMLFRNSLTNHYSYGYNSSDHLTITPIDESVILPPYNRHHYPSYPNTNKKLGRPVQTMKLVDPSIYRMARSFGIPTALELVSSVLTAVLGLVVRSDLEWFFGLTDLGLFGAVGIGLFGAVAGLFAYWGRLFMVLNQMRQDRVKGPWLHRF
jgi:hypothetical protein